MRKHHPMARTQRYLLAGTFTVIPIWITWIVFEFVLSQLSRLGSPWVRTLSRALERGWPSLSHWLLEPWFQSSLAVVVTIVLLYLLGWLATRVVGRRILGLVDRVMERIPLVHTVYGGTRKLIAALQEQPAGTQRVVLIEFPSPDMKTIGFVTRTLTDEATGEELAAVYVPTTPNPTSGYLEIVPTRALVATDWGFDEAMSFIISGGAVAPEAIRYRSGHPQPGGGTGLDLDQ